MPLFVANQAFTGSSFGQLTPLDSCSVRDRWLLITDKGEVNTKLTKLAITSTGTIAAPEAAVRITVVLTGVLVIATLSAAIMQSIPMVG